MNRQHDCESSATEHLATPAHPYHYVGSGLDNVYLSGVKYWICGECKQQSAEIPALKHLLTAIGRVIVEKQSPLTGQQVRFLRKRLSKRSVDFAAMIGMTPQRLSALETTDRRIAEGRDKLIRLIYRDLSGDQKLKNSLGGEEQLEKWLTALHGRGPFEIITATWLANRQWRVQAERAAA
jgi:DNA-binding transcriptional regulator YiaG